MKISACIIAKNEEENLPRLLESIKGKFDEIILVDTGSTDRTIEIAKEYGCKVYEKEWKGFADARNYASSKASGDWIWHFDADFELEEGEYRKAIFFLKNVPPEYDAVMIGVKNFDKHGLVSTYSSQIFIHRNKPEIKWVGKVHEHVNVKLSYGIPVFVNHYGYQDNSILSKKAERNLKLLEEEIKTLDRNSESYLFKLFYIIQSYIVFITTGNEDKSLYQKAYSYIDEYLRLRERLWDKNSTNVFDNHVFTYALTLAVSEDNVERAKQFLEHNLIKDSKYPDLLYYKAIIQNRLNDFYNSIKTSLEFLEVLEKAKKNLFVDGENKVIESANKLNSIINLFEENFENLSIEDKEKIINDLENTFKKNKGEYTGLLFFIALKQTDRDKEAARLLNKLYRLSKDKQVRLRLVVELVKAGEKERAAKFLEDVYT